MSAALFIDGEYWAQGWKKSVTQGRPSLRMLREYIETTYLQPSAALVEALYYNALLPSEQGIPERFSSLTRPRPFGPDLNVILYWTQASDEGRQQQKCVDVGIILGLLNSQEQLKWNTLYFVAGDSDFYEAIELLGSRGVRCHLFSFPGSTGQEMHPSFGATWSITYLTDRTLLPKLYDSAEEHPDAPGAPACGFVSIGRKWMSHRGPLKPHTFV